MKEFIEWLEVISEKDAKVRAVLRRSLTFEPGSFVPAYPYVEPFVRNEENSFRRDMFYLVAGLWAMHWRAGRTEKASPIGRACAIYQMTSGSTSTEQRFITLLAADADQLPYHLRQMIALLKEETIDFGDLLNKLLFWNDDRRRVQNALAREFYRTLNTDPDIDQNTPKEKVE